VYDAISPIPAVWSMMAEIVFILYLPCRHHRQGRFVDGAGVSCMSHSLIITLRSLTGNPRGCVYTEPLWGIPYNLIAPYASVYMLALGLTDQNIGLVLSVSWGFQVFWALMSGAITDKLGRRRTTLIFDILAWSVPALIWAFSQNIWWFLAAGIMNAIWRVTMNSWTCLLVEDADPQQLVPIYTWIHIANQVAGFAAPLAGILVARYS
jgi:DHA1 family tetracycline resistance protein-like MFS transporter